ncbi:histidine kinase [Oxynema sp. CENA135]|uniref:histidine kinase n=1 Tax=Oxynema sp. CENA135 TaxID=984206 RepID=UPI001F176168|nr:histidine kinase [Oxynema sp. CENA135]
MTRMAIPCQIVVENNPALIYASRNGSPEKVRRVLKPFLEKFCQERETAGEYQDTPECLVAQIVVRFGFEICEDDFSNLKVSTDYNPQVEYLYFVKSDGSVRVFVPEAAYRENPSLGLQGCRELEDRGWQLE